MVKKLFFLRKTCLFSFFLGIFVPENAKLTVLYRKYE